MGRDHDALAEVLDLLRRRMATVGAAVEELRTALGAGGTDGGVLRSLLEAVAAELDQIEQGLEAIYDEAFIETGGSRPSVRGTGQRFRVTWDGREIAGINRVSALRRITDVVSVREGADPERERHLPGRTRYEPVTLERGITHDTDFEDWANQTMAAGGTGGPTDFRKDVVIELLDGEGKLLRSYTVFGCWVAEYQALPDLDANANAVALEHIKLEHEGWERDAR